MYFRIVVVKRLLGETIETVRRARQDLGLAHEHFTTASLGILANYRKRTLVQDLLHSLNTIKTLVGLFFIVYLYINSFVNSYSLNHCTRALVLSHTS